MFAAPQIWQVKSQSVPFSLELVRFAELWGKGRVESLGSQSGLSSPRLSVSRSFTSGPGWCESLVDSFPKFKGLYVLIDLFADLNFGQNEGFIFHVSWRSSIAAAQR